MKRSQMGRFAISGMLLECPDSAVDIFVQGQIVVLQAWPGWGDETQYVGVSPLFREVAEGDVIPCYSLTVRREENGVRLEANEVAPLRGCIFAPRSSIRADHSPTDLKPRPVAPANIGWDPYGPDGEG